MQLSKKEIKYVARTRAKEELYYLNIKMKKDESERSLNSLKSWNKWKEALLRWRYAQGEGYLVS
jgi:hypothetical protein